MLAIVLPLIFGLALPNADAGALKAAATHIYIGTALANEHLSDSQYKALATEFNMVTAENSMKWDATEKSQGQYSYTQGDEIASFASANGAKIRGHTLLWHNQIPSYLNSLSKDALTKALTNHIDSEVGHYKGKIYAWDVVNEIFNDNGALRDSVWTKNFNGDEFVSIAFKQARAADPAAKLYINDYSIEAKNSKSNGLYNLVAKLRNASVPIDGVGFQAHFTAGQLPSDFQSNMQRFADLGVEVAVTELDIRATTSQYAQQATDYANTIKACKAVSKCVGVSIWGVVDKYSWITDGNPLVWDSNYKEKPAHAAIETALKG